MYTFSQEYNPSTPPAIGNGSGIAITKDPRFTFLVTDKFGQAVTNRNQYGGQNSLSFNVDVRYLNGGLGPSGSNFETGVIGPTYTFTKEKNATAFGGNPRRDYSLVFKLRETSPLTTNSSGQFNVHHNMAEISSLTKVSDGTVVGDFPQKTGEINLSVTMLNGEYYKTTKFDIFSGDSSSFTPVSGTGANSNFLKSVSVFEQKETYSLSINDGEQPADGDYYFYKVLPYDDFSSGIMTSTPTSGLMYNISNTPDIIDKIYGTSFIILNAGAYCIQTLHTGAITGAGYQVLDVVANISGNIVTGNFYNENLDSSVGQQETYPFRTIKYLAQITDSSGVCSSRELLITDNTLSNVSGVSGLNISEYASNDTGNFARILVSGEGTGVSDYSKGTGYIYLMAQLQYPSGSYKLLRTLL